MIKGPGPAKRAMQAERAGNRRDEKDAYPGGH